MHTPSVALTLVVSGFALATSVNSSAQGQTVEQVVQTIAARHNASAQGLQDKMITSSTARAVGKNVIFENTLRVRRNLQRTEIGEFAESTRDEVIPKTCQIHGNHIGFDRGMYYTFIYKSTYGEILAQFNVDKLTCATFK